MTEEDWADIKARQAYRHQHKLPGPGEYVAAVAYRVAATDIDRLIGRIEELERVLGALD